MKYVTVKTGKELPAFEVRELRPGSNLFVHIATVETQQVISTASEVQEHAISLPGIGKYYPNGKNEVTSAKRQVIDSYVAVIADGATYDRVRDNPLRRRI